MSSQTLRLPGLWCCGTVILQPGCEDWLTSSRILPPAPVFLGYIVPSIRTEEASAEVGHRVLIKIRLQLAHCPRLGLLQHPPAHPGEVGVMRCAHFLTRLREMQKI